MRQRSILRLPKFRERSATGQIVCVLPLTRFLSYAALALVMALIINLPAVVLTNCDQQSLQAALNDGGTITVTCSGAILLTNSLTVSTDAVLDASNKEFLLNGQGKYRILTIQPSINLTVIHAVFQGGHDNKNLAPGLTGEAHGGAIWNQGGILSLQKCKFTNNAATGSFSSYGNAAGGDIYSVGGTVLITDSGFEGSVVTGGQPRAGLPSTPTLVRGGSIVIENGTLSISNSSFVNIRLIGSTNTYPDLVIGGSCQGGVIFAADSSLSFNKVAFNGYFMKSGLPYYYSAGLCEGGALYLTRGKANLVECQFSTNSLYDPTVQRRINDPPDLPSSGGAIYSAAELTVSNCVFSGNYTLGSSGKNTSGNREPILSSGAGIFSITNLVVVNSSFDNNQAVGAYAYSGGAFDTPSGIGQGGAIYSEVFAKLTNCTFWRNTARGGAGLNFGVRPRPTPGSDGIGGALYAGNSSVELAFCTFQENRAVGGMGGLGASLFGPPNAPDGNGLGGALATSFCRMSGNIFNGSTPNSIAGVTSDIGSNLSSDNSAALTNSTSHRNTDPRLGTYGFHGGVVPTIPLLPDSPAIAAAQYVEIPATDARGNPRSLGETADLGAFEGVAEGFIRLKLPGLNPDFPVALKVGSISTNFSDSVITLGPLAFDNYDVSISSDSYLFEPPLPMRLTVDVPMYDLLVEAYQKGKIYLETGATNVLKFAPISPLTYQTQVSSDLVDWTYLAQFQTNASGVLSLPIAPITSTNHLFFRSKSTN